MRGAPASLFIFREKYTSYYERITYLRKDELL